MSVLQVVIFVAIFVPFAVLGVFVGEWLKSRYPWLLPPAERRRREQRGD